jgi:hypothetical protein
VSRCQSLGRRNRDNTSTSSALEKIKHRNKSTTELRNYHINKFKQHTRGGNPALMAVPAALLPRARARIGVALAVVRARAHARRRAGA